MENENLLDRLERKVGLIPFAGKKLAMIPASLNLARSYVKGEYRQMPLGMILAQIGAGIYLAATLDLVADWIPGVGSHWHLSAAGTVQSGR